MAIDYASLKKGGFMRQKQKGYFSLRLQVVGGTLTAENLRIIQEVADKYGHGYVHLTSRQGVEIPFVKYEDIETVKAELARGGCKPGVCGPRVRTVTACQGNAVCQAEILIHIRLQKNWISGIMPGSCRINLNSA